MSKVVPLNGFNNNNNNNQLNLKIQYYNDENSLLLDKPKENTIGIITNIPAKNYYIGSTVPTEIKDNMIWINTATYSTAAFNILKSQECYIYPVSISQYINGIWESKIGKIYFNNTWNTLEYKLLTKDGFDITDTGQWFFATNSGSTGSGSATVSTNSISMSASSSSSSNSPRYVIVTHRNEIDFTSYKTLEMDLTLSYSSESQNMYFWFGISQTPSNASSSDFEASYGLYQKSGSHVNLSLDIAQITGTGYIKILLQSSYRGAGSATITGIRLR